jgi:anti-sigma regulatory factor (Ser/Thr protein kinase)
MFVPAMQTASARASGSYVRRIPAVTPRSPGNARAWAATIATSLGADPDTVALAVTEFLTNVLRYAAGPAQVALCRTEKGVEIRCTDRHPETAADVHPAEDMFGDDDHVSRRGLLLLEAMATSGVHVRPRAGRKEVSLTLPIGGDE